MYKLTIRVVDGYNNKISIETYETKTLFENDHRLMCAYNDNIKKLAERLGLDASNMMNHITDIEYLSSLMSLLINLNDRNKSHWMYGFYVFEYNIEEVKEEK